MTTIAYRAGILAADSLVTVRGHRDGYFCKIRKRGPFLACGAGGHAAVVRFLDWFVDGLPAGKVPDMAGPDDKEHGGGGYIFAPTGLILHFTNAGWTHERAAYFATGAGCDYAYGAMAMGASAEEAVRAALLFETTSGGDVVTLRHY